MCSTGQERLAQLLRKKLFHLHWKGGEVPLDVRNKIVVVPGDMDAPGLGLSDADRQRLQAEVDFVIHSAASISFFEHVHTLLKQNYEVGRNKPCFRMHKSCTGSCRYSREHVHARASALWSLIWHAHDCGRPRARRWSWRGACTACAASSMCPQPT